MQIHNFSSKELTIDSRFYISEKSDCYNLKILNQYYLDTILNSASFLFIREINCNNDEIESIVFSLIFLRLEFFFYDSNINANEFLKLAEDYFVNFLNNMESVPNFKKFKQEFRDHLITIFVEIFKSIKNQNLTKYQRDSLLINGLQNNSERIKVE